jgi:hypothetical protein
VPVLYGRVWAFLRSDTYSPDRAAILQTLEANYRCASKKDFQAVNVYLFERPPPRTATPGREHVDSLSTGAGGETP